MNNHLLAPLGGFGRGARRVILPSTAVHLCSPTPPKLCSAHLEVETVNEHVNALETILFESGAHSDFKVVVSKTNKAFHVHKCILSCASPVMRIMLDHDSLAEVEQSRVVIKDFDEPVVESFLRFCYTGQSPCSVALEDHALALYDMAEKYDVEGLAKHVRLFIIHHINSHNILSITIIAYMHHNTEMFNACAIFLAVHEGALDDVTSSDEYVNIEETQPKLCARLMLRVAYIIRDKMFKI